MSPATIAKETEYTLSQLVEGLGIRRETFKEWAMRGFVEGSIQRKHGARTFVTYTFDDVLSIALFRHLIEKLSLPREVAAHIVRLVRTQGPFRLSSSNSAYIAIARDEKPGKSVPTTYLINQSNGPVGYDIAMVMPSRLEQRPPDAHVRLSFSVREDFDGCYLINWPKIFSAVHKKFRV